MKVLLTIMYFMAFIIGGIELEKTAEYSNAFFSFYGAFTLGLYLVLNKRYLET